MVGVMNTWAILAAAAVNIVLGAIWYMPPVFGRKWMALIGKTREELGSPTTPMVISVLTSLLLAYTMATLMSAAAIDNLAEGVLFSLLLSIGIFAASLAPQLAFEGRPPQLFSIHAGYRIVSMMLMGGILGAWH
jgi:hypothetical protein